MEPLTQLLFRINSTTIFAALLPAVLIALLAFRHIGVNEEFHGSWGKYVYAWSKVVLDTSLVWGITLATAGLIGMAINWDRATTEGLSNSITIVFTYIVFAGLAAALAHALLNKEIDIKLKLKPTDLVILFLVLSFLVFEAISSTGVPYFPNYFHPVLTPSQLILTAALTGLGYVSTKNWVDAAFDANLGITLFLMAIGIMSWFLNWSNLENESINSIWSIACFLFWGSTCHISFYCLAFASKQEAKTNLRVKTWHFTEAFTFYLFLVFAPIGATEFLRESSDQQKLEEKHQAQQVEIDSLRAEIKELKKKNN